MKDYNRLLLILGPLLSIIAWFLLVDLEPIQKYVACTMIWVATWWLHSHFPLHITGLLGVVAATLLGVGGWESNISHFASPIIFLFMGGFFLSKAVEHTELDLWIAKFTLTHPLIKGKPKRLILGVVMITAFLSMFLSNSATTALMVPITLSLLKGMGLKAQDNQMKLLLLIAGAATIGGIATPVGSPPNAIAIGLLETIMHEKITFSAWVARMLPLSILSLGALLYIYRREIHELPKNSHEHLSLPEKLTNAQISLIIILFITCSLWMMSLFSESLVAIMMSLTLFLIPTKKGPLLTWEKAKTIDWGTLLLFGSGLALGQMMMDSGLAATCGSKLNLISHLPPIIFLMIIIAATIFVSEFASNTATANIVVPIVLSTPGIKENPMIAVLVVTMAANLAFMLPAGTPPNAIVYGTGHIHLKDMLIKGFKLNLICLVLILIMSFIWKFY